MARRTLTEIVAGSIRRIRDERGWSARELAERCAQLGMPSLTRGVIAKIESGRRRIEMDEAAVFADALGVSLESLTADSGATLTVLHLSDLGLAPDRVFGQPVEPGGPHSETALADQLADDLDELDRQLDGGRPDLVVVSGDLGHLGRPREYDLVKTFLERLAGHLKLGFDRIVVVPGERDVNHQATRAYFATCDADEVQPRAPYWSNWQRFATLFDAWPDAGRAVRMQDEQPWSLFEIRDLRVVVAGINSTIADEPDRADHSGLIGAEQAGWFAEALAEYERQGWFRLGVLHHDPLRRSPSPTGNLSDAALFEGSLGGVLNLVLHGHGDAAQADRLESGTLVLGAGSPAGPAPDRRAVNRYQLIRISAGDLVRTVRRYDLDEECWLRDGSAPRLSWSIPVEQEWRDAQGTFPTLAARGGQQYVGRTWQLPGSGWVAGEATEDELPQILDPQQLLLDRVADVCQAQHANAVVQRFKGRPPFLRVTYEQEQRTQQMRIGACVTTPSQEVIDDFQARVHSAGPDTALVLVYQGADPPRELRHYARRRGIRLTSFLQFQGLVDLTEYVRAQTDRLASDLRYPPQGYVPHRYLDALAPGAGIQHDLVEELLNQVTAEDGRFVLLLGDFGRGKTFALRELARRIPDEYPYLVPMLIDLRALDKSQSLDAHVAAHLAELGHDDIDMRALRYMLRQGRIVLIFDGFDELVARATYERAADHLQTLLAGLVDATKIVVASRTQHFQTNTQVLTAMGAQVGRLPQRRVLLLSDLSSEQIQKLLDYRYAHNQARVRRRIQLLRGVPGLLDLAQNPRMLTFIADLDEDQLHAVAASGGQISPARLYQEILDHWLSHEERRTQGVRGAPRGFSRDDLRVAVTALARRMWESEELYVGVDELGEVARTLVDLADSNLSPEQIVYTVGSGSLLVRTDDGMFGFIHESVMEWLVAREIAEQIMARPGERQAMLERRTLSALTVDFLCGLADVAVLKEWANAALTGGVANELGRTNASRILARLSSSSGLKLRRALLVNEDLSDRAWPEADLTEATLSGARMINMDLTGASMRGARLDGATLENADLTGADLRGADLSGAVLTNSRLRGCDLTGAKLIDARLLVTDLSGAIVDRVEWRRAVLVNAEAGPEVLAAARAGGAAAVPGQPVETATYPPSLGVRFGFDEGRLPRPVAYDPDGALLAIGNEDGSILVCDARSGAPLRTLVGHDWRAYAVNFSPTEPLLASGSLDGTVRLWDANTGACRHVLTGGTQWVWPMLFNADGTLLAAGSRDDVVRVWDTATGDLRWEFGGHTAPVWTATFDNNGNYLATGDNGGHARVWDIRTGELVWELDSAGRTTFWMRFDRDGGRLAGGGEDGLVRLWSPVDGRLTDELRGHENAVYALDFHPDGTSLVSADTDGVVRRWDLTGPHPVGRELGRHTGAVYRITFSPGRKVFATGDSDGIVKLWDADTGALQRELDRHHASVWPMMFRPDGDQMATSSNDFTTKLWDTSTWQQRYTLRGHGRRVQAVGFSADSTMLATSSNDGLIRVWNPRTGQQVGRLRHSPDLLISAVFSPVGAEIATASNDGHVYLWDAETGVEGRVFDIATDNIWATAFKPDGEHIATANDDDTIQVMWRNTGRTHKVLTGGARARALAFSPDGATLASAGDDPRVRLWDWERELYRDLDEGHTGRVFSIAYDPTGTLLATASHDGTAIVWDAASGRMLRRIEPGRGKLWSVTFHPGGEFLATAGDEHVIDVWSVRTGERRYEAPGHTRRVWTVAYSPDGRLMASGSTDGTVRIWSVDAAARPEHRLTLLGLPNGWVAYTPGGRFKSDGEVRGHFWHTIGMARFEPGELGIYLEELAQVAEDEALF